MILSLSGAHTLGEAKKQNSGFTNEWVEKEDHFDHDYYIQMLNTSNQWTQVCKTTERWMNNHNNIIYKACRPL